MKKTPTILICAALAAGPGWADEPAVKKAVRAVLAAVADDAVDQQFQQQFGNQFRHLYRTELHFLRAVARPTKRQYDQIAAAGEPAFKAVLKKYADQWRGMQQGRGLSDDQSDPRAGVAEAVLKAARPVLLPDQLGWYEKELEFRTAAHRRAMVLSLVVAVDHSLGLSEGQRARLEEILTNNWQKTWNNPNWLTYANNYFPPMPDSKILPILSPAQKDVWNGIPKGNVHFGFQLHNVQAVDIVEEAWEDEPLEPIAPPKEKSTPPAKEAAQPAGKR